MEIIENSNKSRDEYGHCYGSENIILTIEQVNALLNGKCIAFDDGEYTHFLSMVEPESD